MRRSLSVKATYDGVVRLPMSLAMISTLRERKTRASKFLFRQSSSSSSSSIARVIVPIIAFPALGRDEISRGRRRNAARVATRPRPVPPPLRTTDRTTHTKKTTRSLARVPRRITADHRASIVSLAAIRIIIFHRDRRLGGEKRPIHHPIARATRTHRSCCQTPTHEYVVPRSIPIAGPSALLMMTRDARES